MKTFRITQTKTDVVLWQGEATDSHDAIVRLAAIIRGDDPVESLIEDDGIVVQEVYTLDDLHKELYDSEAIELRNAWEIRKCLEDARYIVAPTDEEIDEAVTADNARRASR